MAKNSRASLGIAENVVTVSVVVAADDSAEVLRVNGERTRVSESIYKLNRSAQVRPVVGRPPESSYESSKLESDGVRDRFPEGMKVFLVDDDLTCFPQVNES